MKENQKQEKTLEAVVNESEKDTVQQGNEKARTNQTSKLVRTCIMVIVIAVLSIIMAILFAFYAVSNNEMPETISPMDNIKVSTDATESGTAVKNQAMTYFLGYDDQFVKEGNTITLGNDLSNAEDNIYMQYTIIDDTGVELYVSDLIAPGMEVAWCPSNYFVTGEHEVTFHEQPYKIIDADKEINEENLKPLYYIDQNILLTIIE